MSGVFASSCSLLIRGNIAAARQESQLSICPNFPNHFLGVVVRARMKTEPARRWAVSRELNRRVKLRCGELGIIISPPGKVVQVPPPLPVM